MGQSEELDCYDQPFPFQTDHARFTFFRHADPNLHYVPHEQFRCEVTVVSGLPGAGKDSWIKKNKSDHAVVSLDEIRRDMGFNPTDNQGQVIQAAKERCKDLLRERTSFVFNATNLLLQTRSKWTSLFADYDARIEMVYIEPPFGRLLKQNKSRRNQVPEKVIKKLAAKCEPPTWLEAHALLLLE